MIPLTQISTHITNSTGITIAQLKSKKRTAPIVSARCIFSWLAYAEGYTCKAIGEYLERDHSTIIYQKQKFKDMCAQLDYFKQKAEETRSSLMSQKNKEKTLPPWSYIGVKYHQLNN